MTEQKPWSARNIANQYDDDTMQPADPAAVIPWEVARDRLAQGRTYWLATASSDGRPHVRPVLAVLVDDVLYTTSSPDAHKARNLTSKPTFSCSVSTDDIDFIIEGQAAPVTDAALLGQVAAAYRAKYGWPVEVRDGAFHAPFGAPTAGPPPYQPYALTAAVIFGLGTDETYAMSSTRWRF